MRIYDSVISSIDELVAASAIKTFKGQDSSSWPEGDQNSLLFRDEIAYELGRGTLPGLAGIALTSDENVLKEDEIVVIGQDFDEIKAETPYARIVIALVDGEKMGEGNLLYQNIRKIDYTRYHNNPKGMMVRISSMNSKESLAVSKAALKEHLSFQSLGKLYINAYKKNPAVKAIKIIFITDPQFNYEELHKALSKSEAIAKSLDHLANKVKMDCHSCAIQAVCNEVEALTKKDFKKE